MPLSGPESLALLCVGLVVQFGLPEPAWPRDVRYGFTSVAIVLGALGLESSGRMLKNRILRVLGNGSYSIYLTTKSAWRPFSSCGGRLICR